MRGEHAGAAWGHMIAQSLYNALIQRGIHRPVSVHHHGMSSWTRTILHSSAPTNPSDAKLRGERRRGTRPGAWMANEVLWRRLPARGGLAPTARGPVLEKDLIGRLVADGMRFARGRRRRRNRRPARGGWAILRRGLRGGQGPHIGADGGGPQRRGVCHRDGRRKSHAGLWQTHPSAPWTA